jgi:hypothetical protein
VSAPEQSVHPGRRSAGLVVGGVVALGAVVAAILLRRPTPSPPGQSGPSGFALGTPTVTYNPLTGTATATLTVTNSGTAPASTVVSGQVQYQGQEVASFTMATTPTIPPGQSATVTLQTDGPISPQFAGDTLTAVFSLPDGTSVSVPFQVQGQAKFKIVSATINQPVMPGQYATATVVVENVGGAPGSTTVAGVTELNGVVQGHWS